MASGGPYQVEFLTWKTELGADQGVENVLRSKVTQENVGHASVKISFPYSAQTNQWVTQYCKNIKLYEPQDKTKVTEKERYQVDVPVFYTTPDGDRIYNPQTYLEKHPQASIVTHVYVSLVPGKYAAHRDERDPFFQTWKRNFSLYKARQDQEMETENAHFGFKRAYQGPQSVERTQRQKGKYYIVTEPRRYQHNVTEEEIAYYSLTPNRRNFIQFLDRENHLIGNTPEERRANLINLNKASKDQDLDGKNYLELLMVMAQISQNYPFITRYYDFYLDGYCINHKIYRSAASPDQQYAALKEFFEFGLDEMIEMSLDSEKDIQMVRHQDILSFFRPIMTSLERQEMTVEELYQNIDDFYERFDKICKKNGAKKEEKLAVLIQQYPLIKILYKRYLKLNPALTREDYIRLYLGNNIKQYLEIRDQLLLEKKNRSRGAEADRVILPIASIQTDDLNYKGHPAGLNVEEMLKHIPEAIGKGEGYAYATDNCSDLVQSIGYAGAPADLKYLFTRQALGIASTPQVVANGAMEYANIIYNPNYVPLAHKVGFFQKQYLRQEKKTADLVKRFQKLNEKIQLQDKIINGVIEKGEDDPDLIVKSLASSVLSNEELKEKYFENEDMLKQRMFELYDKVYTEKDYQTKEEGVEEDFEDQSRLYQLAYNSLLKEAIYEYCDQQYHQNIKEDEERLEPDIQNQAGLFKQISEKDPNPLSEQAIKNKMLALSKAFYSGNTFARKRQVLEDFENQGPLYLRACHTIIFEHAPSTENLTDPNFTSMQDERKELAVLKKASFREGGILLGMRAIGSVFATPFNVTDPWHEVKTAKRMSQLAIDFAFENKPSLIRTLTNLARYGLIGAVGTFNALFIAPRRYLSRLTWNKSKAAITRAAKEVARVDIQQAYKTGKISDQEMADLNIPVSEKMQQDKEKSQENILAHQQKEQALFSKENLPQSVVEIKDKSIQQGIRHFKEELDKDKIPTFSAVLQNKILHRIHFVDNALIHADKEFEQKLGQPIKDKLDQWYRYQMTRTAEVKKEGGSKRFIYDPERHGSVIPSTIQLSTDPEEIRDFFKSKIQDFIRSKESAYFFTEQDIDNMTPDQLLAAVEYLAKPTYFDRLKTFEKALLKEMHLKPQITTLSFDNQDLITFKAFLLAQELDPAIIDILEQKEELGNLLIRLQYAECSEKSLQKIHAAYQNPPLQKRSAPIAPQFDSIKEEDEEEPILSESLMESGKGKEKVPNEEEKAHVSHGPKSSINRPE